ncbi:S-adenosyl-L-methionine-dependent methyltransferase [Cucurbitaria berberidis CBS 394.84]|uniref:S-adenosyl-L-methionine-dependent methyltransferase n=1 Tax=Cucurbitaria berberidis CBS 394.84 TaxID=1168544 RepID=A0A9P4LDJ6_9PLEO|nr:S-adenosyl-L-methionine-dependent methyltransferase [Cucurbitaria berberidis CBS 394.84]KAF1850462.1 S-adenosyl-L-methionine-dependent methyltransferase [Cucurbitaria berberidis CBS 394.84]
MESDAISQLKTLLGTARDLRENLSRADRLQLGGLAEALRNELERPDEALFRVTFNEPSHYLGIRLAIQWGVFDALGDVGEPGKSSAQLAENTGADPRLVARFLRHLAANGTIREVDLDTYASTRLSASCRQKFYKDAVGFMFDDFYNVGWKLPSFLDTISHRNPADINNGPFQHAYNLPGKSLYTYFGENTAMAQRFGGMIQLYNAGKPFFWEDGYYPIKERLVDSGPKSDEDVLLIDIGGGDAGDLGLLRKALGSEVKGRLILQELKHIIDRSDQDGYEAQVGDWNQVQPIKGARAYMLQHILHDFSSDDECRRILRNIIPAMTPGYSKLLIKELLIPDRNAPSAFTAMDVNVIQSLSGQERTESQFRNLLESVGFKIEGIWGHQNALDVVIEASLS